MVQRGSGPSFPTKSFESLRISGYILGQEFQGYEAAKLGILRLVDHTHTAAA